MCSELQDAQWFLEVHGSFRRCAMVLESECWLEVKGMVSKFWLVFFKGVRLFKKVSNGSRRRAMVQKGEQCFKKASNGSKR